VDDELPSRRGGGGRGSRKKRALTLEIPFGRKLARSATRFVRRAARTGKRRAAILVYHRIDSLPVDPWELAVTPAHFGEHLDVLKRRARPMPLRELVQAMQNGGAPRDAVAVTLDDGYADNLRHAGPLLEEAGVPATVFVVAGALGQPSAFWWDELAEIFLRPGRLPQVLELEVESVPHRFDLGTVSSYTAEEAERHRRWRGWSRETPTPRHGAYREVFRLLQPLPDDVRSAVLSRIRTWSETSLHSSEDGRPLTAEEVGLLARDGLIEVGAHTMTHPRLSALSEPAQRREIRESRTRLEEVVGSAVASFAYPYGQPGDYGQESVAIVRDAGFDVACANVPGTVTSASDVYQLPRFHVSDCDGDSFDRQWSEWRS
jgi:peptidoglycan/xylan/chitin deacetylase (PgdA/CDA1 family)